jgi:hypothetical protein
MKRARVSSAFQSSGNATAFTGSNATAFSGSAFHGADTGPTSLEERLIVLRKCSEPWTVEKETNLRTTLPRDMLRRMMAYCIRLHSCDHAPKEDTLFRSIVTYMKTDAEDAINPTMGHLPLVRSHIINYSSLFNHRPYSTYPPLHSCIIIIKLDLQFYKHTSNTLFRAELNLSLSLSLYSAQNYISISFALFVLCTCRRTVSLSVIDNYSCLLGVRRFCGFLKKQKIGVVVSSFDMVRRGWNGESCVGVACATQGDAKS